jgi:hypothetical protein
MKNFLSRIFGRGDKEQERNDPDATIPGALPPPKMGWSNTVMPPDADFAPSGFVNSTQAAAHTLSLIEQKKKEEQKIAKIKKLFYDSGRSRASAMEPHQTIELVEQKYGRIWKMIIVMWGTLELHRKLQEILYIDTEGRAGFSFDVVAVLMRLHEIHMGEFGFHGGVHEDRARRGLSFMTQEDAAKLRKHDASVKVEPPRKVTRDKW